MNQRTNDQANPSSKPAPSKERRRLAKPIFISLIMLVAIVTALAVWLLWPAWVWFAVMATGNHFWLDVLAGIVLATIALLITYRRAVGSFIARLL